MKRLSPRTRSALIGSTVCVVIGAVGCIYALFHHDLLGAAMSLVLEAAGSTYFGGWVESRRALWDEIKERDCG